MSLINSQTVRGTVYEDDFFPVFLRSLNILIITSFRIILKQCFMLLSSCWVSQVLYIVLPVPTIFLLPWKSIPSSHELPRIAPSLPRPGHLSSQSAYSPSGGWTWDEFGAPTTFTSLVLHSCLCNGSFLFITQLPNGFYPCGTLFQYLVYILGTKYYIIPGILPTCCWSFLLFQVNKPWQQNKLLSINYYFVSATDENTSSRWQFCSLHIYSITFF